MKSFEFSTEFSPTESKRRWIHSFFEKGRLIVLDSNKEKIPEYFSGQFAFHSYDWLIGFGSESQILGAENFPLEWKKFLELNDGKWSFGFLGYDLKNQLERLPEKSRSSLSLPGMLWWVPEVIITCKEGKISVHSSDETWKQKLTEALQKPVLNVTAGNRSVELNARVTHEKYIHDILQLKNHIQRGDIYEVNYCAEFYAQADGLNSLAIWERLCLLSPMPFSVFIDDPGFSIICASPERFLKKQGDMMVAQPMKGTMRRGADSADDEGLIFKLRNDPKERSENVMIVDLVRNDLSRSAARGSVEVVDLFGVQTFPAVHQMVSTITCKIEEKKNWVSAFCNAFPMGSMTGAPKIRAMELIDEFEAGSRSVYSGTIGYVNPENNCDFNVVIRTLVYDKTSGYLSASVGSAITIQSDPEGEWEECLLKLTPVKQALSQI